MKKRSNGPLCVLGASSHASFAKKVAERLDRKLAPAASFIFTGNGNRFVQIKGSVRGKDVFIIGTQAWPVDTHVLELLMMVRTVYEASAARITVVMPCYPYARSDKKDHPRICTTARLVADLLREAHADRVLVMDLHADQIEGFFLPMRTDHIFAHAMMVPYLVKHRKQFPEDTVLLAGDASSLKRLKPYANALGFSQAAIDKRREGHDEKPIILGIIGSVQGKHALFIDDEVASGGTLIKDCNYVLDEAGAIGFSALASHAVLGQDKEINRKLVEMLNASRIDRFYFTDSVPHTPDELPDRTEIISVTGLIAAAIKEIHNDGSVETVINHRE